MDEVVRVDGLRVHDHAGTEVLDSGDFAVAPGRIVALVGPSGSGKTTLLRAMTGALPAGLTKQAGAVHVLGHDVGNLTAEQLRLLRYRRISFVGQDPASRLNPRMRVRRLLTELAEDSRTGTARALLADVRLPATADILRRRPGQLSGGQQRRVALARALASRPALLLLDEPTAGMDTALGNEIGALLCELAKRDNLAIVFACHDNAIVDAVADDVVELGHTTTASVTVPAARVIDRPSVLSVRDLSAGAGRNSILAGVSFDLAAGEALAVTGVSGTGKTTLARAIVGLHRSVSGNLTLAGEPLSLRVTRRTAAQRRRIQLVPQDPLGTLNPRRSVGETVARPVIRHGLRPPAAVAGRVAELLAQVRLPAEFAGRYPHELSGGQRQRVAIARALAAEPDVLLCDEITSALDAGTADTIMSLLAGLRSARGLAMIVISHDLAMVANHTDATLALG